MRARAGAPRVTPQGLRVGWITLGLAVGIPERLVGISAGHESTRQTSKYDKQRALVERNAGVQLADWVLRDVAPRRAVDDAELVVSPLPRRAVIEVSTVVPRRAAA